MPLEFSPFLMPIKNADFLSDAGKYLAEGEKSKVKPTEKEIKLFEINPNDYKTGTVADKMLVGDIQSTQNKANALYKAGYSQTETKIALSDDIFRITKKYQAAQNLSKKLNSGLDKIKGVKGIRPDKYEAEFIKNAFYNPDGVTLKQELDDSKDYDADVRQFGDIYNIDEAVAFDIQNMAKNSETRDVQERGANKVLRKVKKEIETATGFEPSIDKQGVFEGVVPKHTEAPVTDASKAVNDYITGQANSTQPLNLITDDTYERVKSNDVIMGAVNRDTRKFADEMSKTQGRVPTPEETDIFQKAKLFDIYKRQANAGFKHKTLQAQIAPVTRVTVNTGGGDKGTSTIRDIHTPAFKLYSDMQSKKTTAFDLFKQGKSIEEVAKAVNLDPVKSKPFLESAKLGKVKYSMPLNAQGLDVEFVNSIVDNTNKSQPENDKKSRNELFVELNDNGEWEVKDMSNNNYLLATLPATTLGVGAEQGTKSKNAYIQQKKTGYKGTKNKMY